MAHAPGSDSTALAVLVALALLLAAAPAVAQTPEIIDRTELRVCADPNDLPFSNEKHEGFENKISDLLGKALNLPVRYVWFPQIIGFVRNTLGARQCDLVLGTVAGDDLMQTTSPYYYTSYVMIYRTDKGLTAKSLDAPELKSLRVGVVAGTPPANLLVRYHLMEKARPYALTVDTRFDSATHQLVTDVVNGETDLGLIWGPIAGYYLHRDHLPLTLVPLKSEPGSPRMDYHIAMGVRVNEPEWRRKVNAIIQKEQPRITGILQSYGVPLLDERGEFIKPPN